MVPVIKENHCIGSVTLNMSDTQASCRSLPLYVTSVVLTDNC